MATPNSKDADDDRPAPIGGSLSISSSAPGKFTPRRAQERRGSADVAGPLWTLPRTHVVQRYVVRGASGGATTRITGSSRRRTATSVPMSSAAGKTNPSL